MAQKSCLGIIGGMSWESTQTYYAYLNQGMRQARGGLHSAELILYSFDFARIAALQASGDWQQATDEMIKAGLALKRAGADRLMIATNTMHKMAEEVEAACALPLIHIADATAAAIHSSPSKKPLLLATHFTMSQDFYKGWLRDKHKIDVIVPDEEEKALIHKVIYHELCQGEIVPASKQAYLDIIAQAQVDHGADGVIFGCTEIGLLLSQDDIDLPCFDTSRIHCDFALKQLLA